MFPGPQVHGCKPVLVVFEEFKDRENVLKNAKVLTNSVVTVTEDFPKRTRETRQKLRKLMRRMKKANPTKQCFLEHDKLYVDNKMFTSDRVSE